MTPRAPDSASGQYECVSAGSVPLSAQSLIERLTHWATQRSDVHVLMLVGSQARGDHPADAFSDIDVVLTVDDPDVFTGHDEWLNEIDSVIADVVESTALGGMLERRVLFASGRDVDFSIVPVDMMRLLGEFKSLPEVRELFGRGVRLLVDKVGMADDIATIAPPEPGGGILSESQYRALANGFWYHLIAATRKWRRGELWVAMAWCEGQLTDFTIELARWWTQLLQPSADIWHGSRFIEEWLDPSVMGALAATRTGYGSAEISLSLRRLAELFRRLEADCRGVSGYGSAVDEAAVWRLLEALMTTSPGLPAT
jgi:aminoglycoside 6-adenylyltransferase